MTKIFKLGEMSVIVKNYKEVVRSYFYRLFSNSNLDDVDIQVINSELEYNGFNSFNKHVVWWRINYNSYNQIIRIDPIYDNDG